MKFSVLSDIPLPENQDATLYDWDILPSVQVVKGFAIIFLLDLLNCKFTRLNASAVESISPYLGLGGSYSSCDRQLRRFRQHAFADIRHFIKLNINHLSKDELAIALEYRIYLRLLDALDYLMKMYFQLPPFIDSVKKINSTFIFYPRTRLLPLSKKISGHFLSFEIAVCKEE